MIEIAAAAAAIGALKNIIDIIDKVGDKWFRYEETGELSESTKEHRMQLVVASDQSQVTAQFGGAPRNTVTREQLAQKLTPSDLRHLEALEERMQLVAERWDDQARAIELETNQRTKSVYKQAMRADGKDLAHQLEESLGFIESCGFILDDHYLAMRDIAKRSASAN